MPQDVDWSKWALNKETENETITLERLKIWPLNGEIQGTTVISIFKNSVSLEGYGLSEKEHADQLRTIEEQNMRNQNEYGIEDLEKNDLEHNGKKLYSMSWKITNGSAFTASINRTYYSQLAYYVYFPENFAETKNFYNFIISESYIPGTLISVDTEQILKIIDAFYSNNKKLKTNQPDGKRFCFKLKSKTNCGGLRKFASPTVNMNRSMCQRSRY